jgi:hypothetical protein
MEEADITLWTEYLLMQLCEYGRTKDKEQWKEVVAAFEHLSSVVAQT